MLFCPVGTENNFPSVACDASISAPGVDAPGCPIEESLEFPYFVENLIASLIIRFHCLLVRSQGPALISDHRQAYIHRNVPSSRGPHVRDACADYQGKRLYTTHLNNSLLMCATCLISTPIVLVQRPGLARRVIQRTSLP